MEATIFRTGVRCIVAKHRGKMSRLTVKVKYPKNSGDKLLILFEQIIEQHKELGDESPLHHLTWLNMDEFEAMTKDARVKRDEALSLRATSEGLMQQSNNIVGISHGQTSHTQGTLYFMMTAIRDILLSCYKDNPEMLSTYGFDVVVRTARMPKRKKKIDAK